MLNEQNKNFAVLEIGSDTAKMIAGSVSNGMPYVYCVREVDSRGVIINGVIANFDSAHRIISQLFDIKDPTLLRKASFSNTLLVVPPMGMKIFRKESSIGVMGSSNGQGLIDQNDVVSLLRTVKAQTDALTAGLEIVDIIPDNYTIDGGIMMIDPPIGQKSQQIIVNAKVHGVPKEIEDSHKRIIDMCNLTPTQIDVAPFAATKMIALDHTMPKNYILVDFGGGNTSVSLVGYGELWSSTSFPFGGNHLTAKIASSFAIDLDEAERIKRLYGDDKRATSFKTPIIKKKEEDGSETSIYKENLSQTIENWFIDYNAKLKIALNTTLELSLKNNSPEQRNFFLTLPVVLIGGGSNLNNIESLLKDAVERHEIIRFTPNIVGARDSKYTNLLGMLVHCCLTKTPMSFNNSQNTISTTISRKEIN